MTLWAREPARSCIETLLDDYPDHVEARQNLAILDRDAQAGIKNLQPEVEANPNFYYRRYQLADWVVMESRWREVIDLLKPTAHEFFGSEPAVNDGTVSAALTWHAR